MLGRLVLLFLLTPAVELGLLIQVDKLIGFWPTIGLIIVTGLAGSYLARREGMSAWRRLNQRLSEGGLPGTELVDGVIILVAGALLITPGVLTDVFGFMGLLPPTRALIRKFIMSRVKKKMNDGSLQMQFGFFGGGVAGGGTWQADVQSEMERDRDAGWQGSGREVPGYTEELPESGSGRQKGDAV